MVRTASSLLCLGALALAGGCSSIMDNKTISQVAPEWFEAKSREVKGEGYPSLSDVPEVRVPPNEQALLLAQADALKAESDRLNGTADFALTEITDESIRASAAQARAIAEQGGEPPQPKPSPTPTP
jgi:hypothetical protein